MFCSNMTAKGKFHQNTPGICLPSGPQKRRENKKEWPEDPLGGARRAPDACSRPRRARPSSPTPPLSGRLRRRQTQEGIRSAKHVAVVKRGVLIIHRGDKGRIGWTREVLRHRNAVIEHKNSSANT